MLLYRVYITQTYYYT